MGTAFQPLATAVQTAVTGAGGSGLYYVNTTGKTMFQMKGTSNYIGSLKTTAGTVGGGQAQIRKEKSELKGNLTFLYDVYRSKCFDEIEKYALSSVQSSMLKGLSKTSKMVGKLVEKPHLHSRKNCKKLLGG